jgi:hypothetical protein
MIDRLAVAALPADAPEFLKTAAALDEIEYIGPEPDRWRSKAEPELVAAQAPEHFIDLELADALGPLPHKRFDFEAKVFAAGQRPDTKNVEALIIFYAGWLGHYVGDGSQPLHTTVQYNGWVGPNPNGYTTAHQIHWEFEGPFVAANIHPADVQAKMTSVKPIDGDMFDAYVAYLRHTATFIEKVYQLDKVGGFAGAGTPDSREFTADRLAAGASMLRDMIYSAWLDSAQPVPDPYAGK